MIDFLKELEKGTPCEEQGKKCHGQVDQLDAGYSDGWQYDPKDFDNQENLRNILTRIAEILMNLDP